MDSPMDPLQIRKTYQPVVEILGCPRCDTALLPVDDLTAGQPAKLTCPLCGFEQLADVIEVGNGYAFNPELQQQDAADSPIHLVESVTYDEDLALVDCPTLLDDPVFWALQDGVAPVASFGWVGDTGILGEDGYRLLLVVRCADLPEEDLFRVEFPEAVLADLAGLNEDRTIVLVSQRKGVFFPEAAEVYLEALREAGARPGERATVNTWVQLDNEA
jgi:hypothetical protein